MADQIPIACTLDGDEARRRWESWGVMLAGRTGVERTTTELRIHFVEGDPATAGVRRLVAAERECCAFVDWEIEEGGGEVVLSVRGRPDGVDAMAESFRL